MKEMPKEEAEMKLKDKTQKPEGYAVIEVTGIGGNLAIPEEIFEIVDARERFRAARDHLRAEFTDRGICELFLDDDFRPAMEAGTTGDAMGAVMEMLDEEMASQKGEKA